MTSQPESGSTDATQASQITKPLREIATLVLVGADALLLLVALLTFLIPDNNQFENRAGGAFFDFVGVVPIVLPLLAVLLATHVRPPVPRAKLITQVALAEYAASAVFGVIALLGWLLTTLADGEIWDAFTGLLVRVAYLGLFGIAAYVVLRLWQALYYVPKPKPAPGVYGQPQSYGQPGQPQSYGQQPPYGQPGQPGYPAGYPQGYGQPTSYGQPGGAAPGYPSPYGQPTYQPGVSAGDGTQVVPPFATPAPSPASAPPFPASAPPASAPPASAPPFPASAPPASAPPASAPASAPPAQFSFPPAAAPSSGPPAPQAPTPPHFGPAGDDRTQAVPGPAGDDRTQVVPGFTGGAERTQVIPGQAGAVEPDDRTEVINPLGRQPDGGDDQPTQGRPR